LNAATPTRDEKEARPSSVPQTVPAIVMAGDGGAARAVCGESKVFLEVGGQPLVVHAVLALQKVPEVSEVWVVGDATRLEACLTTPEMKARIAKPLHILPQHESLYDNAWQTYRQLLAGAGGAPRDPGEADADRTVLYLSGDLPFPSPAELSEFVSKGLALDVDFAFGVVPEESLLDFLPSAVGGPGIRMASYNVREGRFRQSNLHLARPARIGLRKNIGEMYHLRYQRNPVNILKLAILLIRKASGSGSLLRLFFEVHLAALFDRMGFRKVADGLRQGITQRRVEKALSRVVDAELRFVITHLGGCAIDIDSDEDYRAVSARYEEWCGAQARRAEKLYVGIEAGHMTRSV